MKSKQSGFEEFLIKKHSKQYRGIDDNMADDFEQWLQWEFSVNDWIKLGDEYARSLQKKQKQDNKSIDFLKLYDIIIQ